MTSKKNNSGWSPKVQLLLIQMGFLQALEGLIRVLTLGFFSPSLTLWSVKIVARARWKNKYPPSEEPEPDPEPVPPDYSRLKHRELKDLCRRRLIPQNNASKGQMVERLLRADERKFEE